MTCNLNYYIAVGVLKKSPKSEVYQPEVCHIHFLDYWMDCAMPPPPEGVDADQWTDYWKKTGVHMQSSCSCIPDCLGDECGDDGCGGSCGQCEPYEQCVDGDCWHYCAVDCLGRECGPLPGDSNCVCGRCFPDEVCNDGQCCKPDCEGKECGDDGCGSDCGTCPEGYMCTDNQCVKVPCAPECDGKECGPTGCDDGFVCGICPQDTVCQDGICTCETKCKWWQECGDDGCGGECGLCPDGHKCESGKCVAPACVPECASKECGSDGCEGSCGTCPNQQMCWEGSCNPINCQWADELDVDTMDPVERAQLAYDILWHIIGDMKYASNLDEIRNEFLDLMEQNGLVYYNQFITIWPEFLEGPACEEGVLSIPIRVNVSFSAAFPDGKTYYKATLVVKDPAAQSCILAYCKLIVGLEDNNWPDYGTWAGWAFDKENPRFIQILAGVGGYATAVEKYGVWPGGQPQG